MASNLNVCIVGLTDSGKTTLLASILLNTSAVHLIKARLEPFMKATGERIKWVDTDNEFGGGIRDFPHDQIIDELAQVGVDANDRWITPTSHPNAVRKNIEFHKYNGRLRRLLAAFGLPHKNVEDSIDINFYDTPGEWLIDLALTRRSFPAWSKFMIEQAKGPARCELPETKAWLHYLNEVRNKVFSKKDVQDIIGPDKGSKQENSQVKGEVNSAGPNEDNADSNDPVAMKRRDFSETMERGRHLYTQYLLACREKGLRFLQPGHFIHRPNEPAEGDVRLCFCPMLPPKDVKIGKGELSLFDAAAARYDFFRKEILSDYEEQYLVKYDRQIILVDVLTALSNGKHCFDDMNAALQEMMVPFTWGRRWFSKGKTRITKVVVAPSKADLVHQSQKENLCLLVKSMMKGTIKKARNAGAKCTIIPIAAVSSSVSKKHVQGGREIRYLEGALAGDALAGDALDGLAQDGEPFIGNYQTGVIPPSVSLIRWDADGRYGHFVKLPFIPLDVANLHENGVRNTGVAEALAFLLGDDIR